MLSDANFLLLDEPTNNLDLLSCQVLENTLDEFEGERFKRIAHIKHLIDAGELDTKLRWTGRERKAS